MASRRPSGLWRAAVALAVVALAALIGFATRPALAAAPATDDRADAAAAWLARQLVDGERFESVFDGVAYPDQGLTIDALLALSAAGTGSENIEKIIAWLATPDVLNGYLGTADDPYFPGFSAGSTAKTLLAAQVADKDGAAFGGIDLVGRLLGLQAESGRFADTFSTDYSNAIGQSLAVIALDRAGGHEAQVALGAGFLKGTQCDDGGFPVTFDAASCDSQVDATAYVVQALLAAGEDEAAADGVTWLVAKQGDGGGFGDDAADSPAPENGNSSGVAALALRAAGKTGEAGLADKFVLGLQVDCDGAVADRGAVRYTASSDLATAPRSTAQAILGLVGTPLAALTAEGARAELPELNCVSPTSPPATTTPDPTGTPSPPVTTTTTTTAAGTTTTTTTTTSRAAAALPVTGSPLRPILTGGAALILGGTALLVALRVRRRAAEG